ncbi:MAG: oligosaccharide flippase family protein [Deltaproteobacteria bacterium]|jgi:O-antigen/teichoic acid export membrane protein
MSQIKHNIVANFLGTGWTAIVTLGFVPLYIHFMGIEAYGLVGFFAVLMGVFSLLDMGLSATMSREMARLSVSTDKAQEMHDLVRTLEVFYWGGGAVIALVVIFFAKTIALHWVKPGQLSTDTVTQAITLMGVAMALQWPFNFYAGGLIGLQRQVVLNGLIVTAATIRGVGAVLILWLVSPTIQAFFVWQIISSGIRILLVAIFLWRSLPPAGARAGFKFYLFRGIWRFAAGITGISTTALILTQLDKIILSKLLTLEMFGYYMLANVAASAISYLVSPCYTAIYPRLTQLVAAGNRNELREVYHRGCQLVSVLILPTAAVIAIFSPEILLLWTQSRISVEHTWLILSLLVVASALNGLKSLPYALQLANGWTSLTFYGNLIALIIMVPVIVLMTLHFEAVGAAIAGIILYGGFVLFLIPLAHRRLLPGEKWRWYLEDVGYPLLAALGLAGVGRWLIHGQMSLLVTGLFLLAVYVAALTGAALAASLVRTQIMGIAHRLKMTYGT